MKRLTLLAFLIPCLCFGQDYQTVRSDFIRFFSQWSTSDHGVKIDSTKVIGSDSIFFNYLTIREHTYSDSLYAFVPSWLGSKIVIKPNGVNLFFNAEGDTICIETQAQVAETWNLFQLDSVSYLEALVEGIGIETVLDSLVETKRIRLQAKDIQGQSVNHPMNGKVIVISKTLGFLKAFDFHHFPEDTKYLELVGMENPDRGIYRLTWGDIYDFQEGDEFHYKKSWFSGIIKKVIDITGSGNEKTIVYDLTVFEYDEPYYPSNPFPNLVITYDTIDVTHSGLNNHAALMPMTASAFNVSFIEISESDSMLYGSRFEHSLGFHGSGRLAYYSNSNSTGYSQDTNGLWSEIPTVSGGTYTRRRFGNGIGRTYYNYWYSDGLNFTEELETLRYFKKGSEESGTPFSLSLMLGKNEVTNKKVFAHPNPVKIGQPIKFSAVPNTVIRLLTINGQQLSTQNDGSAIQTDGLTPGLYLIRFETPNGVSTEKIVVNE